jgi:hypothetical protein
MRFGTQDGAQNAEMRIPKPKDAKKTVGTAVQHMNKPQGMYNMKLKPLAPPSSVLSSSLNMAA